MRQFLAILAICLATSAAKSQNVFPTTAGSKVGIGTTTPGAPLEINTNNVGDSVKLADFFAPINTGVGNASKLRFGTLNTSGNSAELAFFYKGNNSDTNRIDIGFHSKYPALSIQKNGNMGMWTNSPTHPLTLNVGASSLGIALYNTSDQTTNYERAVQGWGSNQYALKTVAGGTGVLRDISINTNFLVSQTLSTTGLVQVNRINSFTGAATLFGVTSTFGSTTASQKGVGIFPTVNQSATAGYTMLYISPKQTAIGSGAKYLIDAGINSALNGSGTHSSMFNVTSTGKGYFASDVGIGTNAPTAQFHTTGAVRFAGLTINDSLNRFLVSDTNGNVAYKNLSSLSTGWGFTGNVGTNPATNFIGTSDNLGLSFRTNNTNRLYIDSAGNVGIGTTSPTCRLYINNTPATFPAGPTNPIFVNSSAAGDAGGTSDVRTFTVYATGTGSTNIYSLHGVNANSFNSLTSGTIALMTGIGAGVRSNTAGNTSLAVGTSSIPILTSTGNFESYRGYWARTPQVSSTGVITTAYAAFFDAQKVPGVTNGYGIYQLGASDLNYFAGNVGIGTSQISDTTYKLFVEKGIRTRKIKVDAASIVWADYVFDKDYKLLTLPEVDRFIQENKHLPGVASTQEVEKNGIDLGENQAILLKKVEELTLYMIEHDKKIIDLEKKVTALSTENAHLKKTKNSRN